MIDNHQSSFTLFVMCCEGKSRLSSFCKITSTARKAGKQIAQTDGLLITGSIKSQIHCLLGDIKVGMFLNMGFHQFRESSLQSVDCESHFGRLGSAAFDVISSVSLLNFSKDLCRHPFLCFIDEVTNFV